MIEKFYRTILGLDTGWKVDEVTADNARQEVNVHISFKKRDVYTCPMCGKEAAYHDTQKRQIKYLDTCESKTWIELKTPGVHCPLCGMVEIEPAFINKVKSE